MAFDYFYGKEAEQFTFFRVPKILFSDERFNDLSLEAKVLYGILLDRMSLSVKNGWLDDKGRVYIIFTLEEAMETLGYAKEKTVRIISQLESIGLITKYRQGFGKPNLIYVKNFVSEILENKSTDYDNMDYEPEEISNDKLDNKCDNTLNNNEISTNSEDTSKSNFKKFENRTSRSSKIELQGDQEFENRTSRSSKIETQEVRKSNPNNTNNKDTDTNENSSLINTCSFTQPKPVANTDKGNNILNIDNDLGNEQDAVPEPGQSLDKNNIAGNKLNPDISHIQSADNVSDHDNCAPASSDYQEASSLPQQDHNSQVDGVPAGSRHGIGAKKEGSKEEDAGPTEGNDDFVGSISKTVLSSVYADRPDLVNDVISVIESGLNAVGTIRISRMNVPAEDLHERFLKLTTDDAAYEIERLIQEGDKIRSPRAILLYRFYSDFGHGHPPAKRLSSDGGNILQGQQMIQTAQDRSKSAIDNRTLHDIEELMKIPIDDETQKKLDDSRSNQEGA